QGHAVEHHAVADVAGREGEGIVARRAADRQRLAAAGQGQVVADGDGERVVDDLTVLVGGADANEVGGPGREVEGVGRQQVATGDREEAVVRRAAAAYQAEGEGVPA